jgi:protein-tyrosine phosphatase
MSDPHRVLFVCLGNICRSPAAEGVFLHQLERAGLGDRFLVDSAGTGGWHSGEPADRRMRQAATARGITLISRARQITIDDLHDFDHILTMDGDNLRAVQALAGGRLTGPALNPSPTTAAGTGALMCLTRTTAGPTASSRCWICWRTPAKGC